MISHRSRRPNTNTIPTQTAAKRHSRAEGTPRLWRNWISRWSLRSVPPIAAFIRSGRLNLIQIMPLSSFSYSRYVTSSSSCISMPLPAHGTRSRLPQLSRAASYRCPTRSVRELSRHRTSPISSDDATAQRAPTPEAPCPSTLDSTNSASPCHRSRCRRQLRPRRPHGEPLLPRRQGPSRLHRQSRHRDQRRVGLPGRP